MLWRRYFGKRIHKFFSLAWMIFLLASVQVFAEPSDNPFVNKTIEIITKLKTWSLALIGVLSVVKVIQYALQYQSGGDDEKQMAVKSIRKTLMMGGGVFFLVWFASYVVEQYSGITP